MATYATAQTDMGELQTDPRDELHLVRRAIHTEVDAPGVA